MIQLPDTTTEQGQREASALLAGLMGWECKPVWGDILIEPPEYQQDPYGVRIINLYHQNGMKYAWRVLNWAAKQTFDIRINMYMQANLLWCDSPTEAQRSWLNKVLELANEAGMLDAAAKVAQEEQARLDNRRKSAQRPGAGIVGSKLPMSGAAAREGKQ